MTEVKGWCLTTDRTGTPELAECSVERTHTDGQYIVVEVDTEDRYVASMWTLGINFFLHLYPGLLALRTRIRDAINGKHMEIAYLETLEDHAEQLIEHEKNRSTTRDTERR